MFTAHVVLCDSDGVVTSVEDIQQADIWINSGFFVFRRDVIDYIKPAKSWSSSRFARLIEEGRAARVSLRGLLGADGHDQGQATAGLARRKRPCPLAISRRSIRDASVTLRLPLADARAAGHARPRARLPRRRHRDRLRRDPARADARPHDVEVTWVVLSADGERADEARASAGRFLGAAARAEVAVDGFRDGFFPYVGAEVKTCSSRSRHRSTPTSF